ncbi:MAG: NAD(P)-binding domain-containing protein [Actinomycetota bacterium]|nr:NAD(P)-binding domain-containing protein [Actinomycetota bacterium]
MTIAVLGTGMVGQAIAGRLDGLGHAVVVGTRDVDITMSRPPFDEGGSPTFAAWAADHPAVRVASFADVAAASDLVVNATSGAVTLDALAEAGAANLAGKVLLDISNPLDFSQGFPPTLFVKDSDSLGEQVQAAFPDALVVKSLNTMTAALMIEPRRVGGGEHSVFVSGNDLQAKARVVALLHEFGHTDVIDLGDITTSRGPEMFLPLWLRTMQALGTGMFNIKVVRP